MKNLEDMNPRDYGMNPREEIVAAAMKAYLLSMPEGEPGLHAVGRHLFSNCSQADALIKSGFCGNIKIQ